MYHSLSMKSILFCFAFPCEPWLLLHVPDFPGFLFFLDKDDRLPYSFVRVLSLLNLSKGTPFSFKKLCDEKLACVDIHYLGLKYQKDYNLQLQYYFKFDVLELVTN
jgi:hypothetical protein